MYIYKLVIVVSIDTSQSVPPAQWDSETRHALSNKAFEPFQWPEMSSETPTLVDLKLKIGDDILGHMEFVAYRTELDMSITRCQFNQAAVQLLDDQLDNITVQCFAFQGYKISAAAVEPGGRMYQCGPRGTVVATDYARTHIEIRRVVRNSADAFGNDADKLEFKMRDGRELKLQGCRSSIPPSCMGCGIPHLGLSLPRALEADQARWRQG